MPTAVPPAPALFASSHVPPAMLDALAARATTAAGSRDWIDVVAPFTGAQLARIPRGGTDDVAAAVSRARRAQPTWAARPVGERAEIVVSFHDRLLAREDEVLDLVQMECGKARLHAYEEVADTANVARYYAYRAERFLRPRRRRGAMPLLTSTVETRRPIGVAGFIVPWNYPLTLAITDAIPALLAGNAAIVRPDPQSSLTALWVLTQMREAGLPEDVLQVVTGEGPEVGPPLASSVDFIMFTGSTGVGRSIARLAGERLIGCSLELGGKNPLIVLDDADVPRAVDGAIRGCFAGAGQLCLSFERLFVHERIADRFVSRFVERARGLTLGAGLDWTADVGSLASARQLARVESHVNDAVARGARLLTGGRHRPDIGPWFYEPTVLSGVKPDMLTFAEETFGPVVAVYPFTSDEDAVAEANATRYGLNASIWSRDLRRARALAARIEAGAVNVNEAYGAAWGSVDAPVGGFKDSGLGRRHGRDGLLKFTEAQTIAVQRGLPIGPTAGLSRERYRQVLSAMLRLLRRVPGLR